MNSLIQVHLGAAIRAMQSIDVTDAPGEMLRQTHAAMRDAVLGGAGKSSCLRLTAAAVVMLALAGMAVFMTPTHRSYALADVVGRVQATRTLRSVLVDPRMGGIFWCPARARDLRRMTLFSLPMRQPVNR